MVTIDLFSCNRGKSAIWYIKRRIPSQNLVTDYSCVQQVINHIYRRQNMVHVSENSKTEFSNI